MTCLCNIPSDLQSNAIAEPKTKALAIFLSKVNRRCAVYSWVLKQDVGITGFSMMGVCVMRGEELRTVLFALAVVN